MLEKLELIGSYNLIGAKITDCRNYSEGRTHAELWLTDDEYTRTGVRKLGLNFYNATASPEIKCDEIISSVICGIEFEPTSTGLTVSLEFEDGRVIKLAVTFNTVQCTEYEYEGMSYTNVYEDSMQSSQPLEYIFDEQYEAKTSECEVGCGYIVRRTEYADIKKENGRIVSWLYAYKAVLIKDNEEIFSYQACGDTTPKCIAAVIRHSNGKEYFLFKEDLYGLSVLDIEDQKTYHYIPAGYQHDRSYPCGESFIITDIHYDTTTDLIALGGCFWAGPGDVMVGDFSDPMNYNPRYINIHYIIDPEYDEVDNIDFVKWEKEELACTGDGKPFSISVDTIRNAIKTGKYMH